MPRLFIALSLSDEAKDRLGAIKVPDVPGVRVLGRQELHLTLHFLGEVAPPSDEAIRRALQEVQASAFAITIKGVGRFPPEGQPHVLWAGVENGPSLLGLHQSIGATLTKAIGFQPETRPYSPHVTLARLKTPAPVGAVEEFLEQNTALHVPSILVERFTLYSSVVVNDLPQYREEAEFSLR
jgi:RNA 2',3'-cyclic 3'-phosphodiesterase